MSITEHEGVLKNVDENGNVQILYPDIKTDSTLSISGKAADAAITGNRLTSVESVASNALTTATAAKTIAEGKNRSFTYASYADMVNDIMDNSPAFKIGDNIFIGAIDVPDLWVYSKEDTFVGLMDSDEYLNNEIFTALKTEGFVHIGFYKLAILETQKVDLSDIEQDIADIRNSIPNIEAGTEDLTPGESYLESGKIYMVYE